MSGGSGSSGWSHWPVVLVLALTSFTDDLVFSLPLTFLPQQLEILDYSAFDISCVVGAFAWANQISFILITLHLFAQQQRGDKMSSGYANYRYRMRVLIWATMIHFLGMVVSALFPSFQVILACRFAQGIVSPMIAVLGLTLAAQISPPAVRASAISAVVAGCSAGELLGNFAGGSLYALGGMILPFLAGAALAGLNLTLLVYSVLFYVPTNFKEERHEGDETAEPGFKSSWAVFKALITDHFVLAMCGVVFVATCVKTALEVVLPLFLQNQMGANARVVANTWVSFAIFFMAASMLWGYLMDRRLMHPVNMILQNLLLLAGSTAMVFYWRDIRTILTALALFGIALGGSVSPSCAALTEYCEVHPKLKFISEDLILALFNDFWAFGMVFGTFLAGMPNEFDDHTQIKMLIGCGIGTLIFSGGVAILPRVQNKAASTDYSSLPGGVPTESDPLLKQM